MALAVGGSGRDALGVRRDDPSRRQITTRPHDALASPRRTLAEFGSWGGVIRLTEGTPFGILAIAFGTSSTIRIHIPGHSPAAAIFAKSPVGGNGFLVTGTGPFPEPLTVTGGLAGKVVAELPSFAVNVLLQVGFRQFYALSPLLGEAELDIDQNWGAAGTVFRQAAIVSAKIARDLYKARDTKPSDVEKTLWWICHQVLQYGGQQPKPKPSAEKLEESFKSRRQRRRGCPDGCHFGGMRGRRRCARGEAPCGERDPAAGIARLASERRMCCARLCSATHKGPGHGFATVCWARRPRHSRTPRQNILVAKSVNRRCHESSSPSRSAKRPHQAQNSSYDKRLAENASDTLKLTCRSKSARNCVT